MRLAYEALKLDGGFPDLTNYCLKRLKQLDPKYKTTEDFNKYTPEEEKAANKDVLNFLNDMEKADKKLQREKDQSGAIFDHTAKENTSSNVFSNDIEQKRKAENERLKGNEFMRAKDYQEAIDCYTKSLDIFEEAATFGNRAMANLRLKRYG
jgi:tetratricopeptide (TPR) repeat protein